MRADARKVARRHCTLFDGKTTQQRPLFGSPVTSLKGIPPPLPAPRELRVRTNWEEAREAWKFSIYHHGRSCVPLHW